MIITQVDSLENPVNWPGKQNETGIFHPTLPTHGKLSTIIHHREAARLRCSVSARIGRVKADSEWLRAQIAQTVNRSRSLTKSIEGKVELVTVGNRGQ